MKRTLLQFDPDKHASSFDAMVAIDSDTDHLLQYHGVAKEDVQNLVYGAIFTRGPKDLKNTAIFVGGSNVAAGEELLQEINATFFGPMRVSVLMDANGANTTAAAAVVAAKRHAELKGAKALVLAGTGPVGQRVARLLVGEGTSVKVASRSIDRAQSVCDALSSKLENAKLTAVAPSTPEEVAEQLRGCQLVFAAGAAGIQLLSETTWRGASDLQVAIDLNAVPPLGIEGIQVFDTGVEHDGVFCYGAIGVGGTKMKIHKAAIAKLFTENNLVLDAEQIYEIGLDLED